ncbi:MFS transporter [Candidatus Parcubacteria bacterium]|nr:MAG: MFS transporter [Candidatus Parcubacteria bacterium]
MKIFKKLQSNEILLVLADSSFLYFILSVIFSQIAINMMNVVLIFLIFFLTSSNFLVSVLIAAFMVPQILLSFFGGVIADLRDKKIILFYGNILRGIILLLLFLNSTSVPLIYFVTLFVAIATQFYIPAETPVIPKLLNNKHLTAGNSVFGVAMFGSVMIGYVLAGPAINFFGRSDVFILISGLLFIATIFIYLIPSSKLKSNNVGDLGYSIFGMRGFVRDNLRGTFAMLRKTKGVVGAFILLSISQVIILILGAIIPGYAKTILEVDPEKFSLLLFAPASFGMIIASFMIGSLFCKTNKEKLMTWGLFLSGLVFCLLPFTSKIVSKAFVQFFNQFLPNFLVIDTVHLAVFLAFFAGFSNALVFIPSQTVIQENVPEDFRSKVYGLLFSVVGLLSLIPILASGGIADILGVGTVLFIIGFSLLLLGVFKVFV